MSGVREETAPRADRDALGDEVWLVLGGGGLKGLSHVGAWQALEEMGVEVAGVVGTSIGALVGVCLSGGMTWDELVPRALELERSDIVRFKRRAAWVNGIRAESVFQGDVLRQYIEDLIPVQEWDELSVPVQINATDLETGEPVWFGPGARTDATIADAIYASAALPLLYPPARIDGAYLVDGGTADQLPVFRAQLLGASGIVAVDAGSGARDDAEAVVEQGLVAIHGRVFSILTRLQRQETVTRWDGVPLQYVRPELDGYGTFDFGAVKYFLEEGYRATRAAFDGG